MGAEIFVLEGGGIMMAVSRQEMLMGKRGRKAMAREAKSASRNH